MSRNQTDAKRHLVTASLLAGAMLLGSTPTSFAGEPTAPAGSQNFTFPFAYSSQDLNTEAGAAEVLERLQHQVRRHCRSNGGRSVHDHQLARQCADETLEAAISTIGSSSLAGAYSNRTDG